MMQARCWYTIRQGDRHYKLVWRWALGTSWSSLFHVCAVSLAPAHHAATSSVSSLILGGGPLSVSAASIQQLSVSFYLPFCVCCFFGSKHKHMKTMMSVPSTVFAWRHHHTRLSMLSVFAAARDGKHPEDRISMVRNGAPLRTLKLHFPAMHPAHGSQQKKCSLRLDDRNV